MDRCRRRVPVSPEFCSAPARSSREWRRIRGNLPSENRREALNTTCPCPCCGYIVHRDPPGSYNICPICFWEDEISQLRFPETTGANHVSPIQAQRNFSTIGAIEERFLKHARNPHSRKSLRREIHDQVSYPIG